MTVWRRVTVLGLHAWAAFRSLCAVPRGPLMRSPPPTHARGEHRTVPPRPRLGGPLWTLPAEAPPPSMESQRGPPILLHA